MPSAIDLRSKNIIEAVAVAKRLSAKFFQLSSEQARRLCRDQYNKAKACELLALIYNWFTEGFDAPDLKTAKALLTELAEQSLS